MKVRKKDIQAARRPDAVLEGGLSLFDWLWDRRNLVFGLLLAVVGGIIVWSLIASHMDSKKEVVGAKLSEAADISMRTVEEKPATPGAADDETKPETFPNKADKAKALNDALTGLADKSSDTPAGLAASLDLARVRFSEGKWDEAISLAQKYLDHPDTTGLAVFAHEIQGDAYAAKKQWTEADEAFKKMADDGAPARSLFNEARLLDMQGKKDEARKSYEKVIADYEKESAAADARVRLDLLDLPPAGTGALAAPVDVSAPEKTPALTPTVKGLPQGAHIQMMPPKK